MRLTRVGKYGAGTALAYITIRFDNVDYSCFNMTTGLWCDDTIVLCKNTDIMTVLGEMPVVTEMVDDEGTPTIECCGILLKRYLIESL